MPRDEQFDAVKLLLDDGVIAFAGLSEVSVEDIEAAVQGIPGGHRAEPLQLRRPRQRGRAEVLRGARHRLHPLVPAGRRRAHARGLGALDAIAKAHGATQSQIAVAWLLQRSPVIIPIPGTSKVAHLEENVKAGEIELTQAEFQRWTRSAKRR